jgi:hypothetical protein
MKNKKYYAEQEWRYTADAIVKYPPQYYNKKGIYTKCEWTERDDVGLIFDNHLFTIEEYLLMEQKYVNAVLRIMELLNCKYLTITYIAETSMGAKYNVKRMLVGDFFEYDKKYFDFYASIYEGKRLNIKQVEDLVRLNLRQLSCTSFGNEKHHLEFHFGNDFYMYCNNQLSKEILKIEIEKIGLHLNPINR